MTRQEIAKFLLINPAYFEPVSAIAIEQKEFERIAGSMVPKECYNNALNAMIILDANAVIIGVAVINKLGFPVEHAWIEMPDGSHADPTFQDQHGENYANQYTYYSLYRIPRREYLKFAQSLSQGHQVMAIDVTSLRRHPDTAHLFNNERMAKLHDVIGQRDSKGKTQEDS